MGEVFVALGGADSLQRAAVAPDWRVGDVRENRQNGIGFYGKFFRMTAVAARSVEKTRKNVDRNALKILLVGIIYKVFGKYLWCAESDLCKTEKIRGIFIAP